MTNDMIIQKVEKIKAIESFVKELEAEAESYKDEIKALMNTEAV